MQLRADFSLVTGKRLGWPGKGDRRTNKQTFQQGSTTCRVAVWWLVSIFSGNCSCHWQSPGPHVHAHAIGVVSSSSANYLPLIRSTSKGLGIEGNTGSTPCGHMDFGNGQHVTCPSVAALAIVCICIRQERGGMSLTCSWKQIRST